MISGKTLKEIENEQERYSLKVVEAVLFVAGKYLSMQELISLTDLNPLIIREVIEKLKEKYNKDDSAIEILERDKLYKMDITQDFHFLINRLAGGSSEFSKAEQETLAIIAYKQPIKQSVIIKIRGNKAYDHVKKFVQIGLIKAKKEGHTNILSLSEEFYDYFNVSSSEENPLKAEGFE
jgi:segregation and condensation protein B